MKKTFLFSSLCFALLLPSFVQAQQEHGKTDSTEKKQKTLWTCGMHPSVIQEQPGLCPICHMKLTPITANSGSEIRIDPVLAQNMGLRIVSASEGPLHRRIRLSGLLKEAEPRKFDITLQVEGYISKLHADTEGMFLKKGDSLYDLYSPELFYAQERYLNAQRVLEKQDSEQAAGTPDKNQSFFDSAKDNLRIWGMTEDDLEELRKEGKAKRITTFRAPFSGFVLEKNVIPGSLMPVGSRLMRLVDLSILWLDLQVFEQDLALLRLSQRVEAKLPAFSGEKFEGNIIFLDPRVDLTTRSSVVRIEMPNPEFRLKPGMFASAEIEVEVSAKSVLIPREAVIDTGTRQVVFVASGENRYLAREVKLGFESETGLVEVREGLMPTERVVTSGQFLLDSESRFREAQEKWRSENLAGSIPAKTTATSISPNPSALSSDSFFKAYLKMSQALAKDQEKEAADLASLLQESIQALLSQTESKTHRGLLEKLQTQAKELTQKTIVEQRKRFQIFSETAIELLQKTPPSNSLASKLFITHCPMYPGSWIQIDEEILNPYYGEEMLHCGEVTKILELKKP